MKTTIINIRKIIFTVAISHDDGTFVLDTHGKNCVLRFSLLGYKSVFKGVSTDMGVESMEQEAKVLNEIVVKSRLPQTLLKNGGMLTNITETMLERAGTA